MRNLKENSLTKSQPQNLEINTGVLPQDDLFRLGVENLHMRYYTQKQYFARLQKHFIKKGKKSTVEKLFRDAFLMPARRKGNFWAVKMHEKFKRCEVNATYNIRLKVQKRGRRVKYRVTYLEKTRWLKKALLPLALTIKTRKSARFMDSFQKEVDLLSEGRSEIKTKRDDYHKLALSKTPYSWRRSRKKNKIKRTKKSKVTPEEAEKEKKVRKFGGAKFYFQARRWYYWKAPMARFLKSKYPLALKLAKLRVAALYKDKR